MRKSFDVIVLGLGAMGSSAAYHLAERGLKVLGLEQFTPAHDKGSSHGKTRVIRQSYYEDPTYVPLLLRAYELWRKLEGETGDDLLFETGGLMMGSKESRVFSGSLRSAREHQLSHEVMDTKEISRRFPAFTPQANHFALYEKHAGYLMAEKCVTAHLQQATRFGAQLQFSEKVLEWSVDQGGVATVKTTHDTYEAGHLVISPGPWAPEILKEDFLPLKVERQVLYWFEAKGGIEPFLPDKFPIFIWETEEGTEPYGFPAIDGPGGGVKLAFYHVPNPIYCTPETIDRTVHAGEIATMQATISGLIPALDSVCLDAMTCLYTNTPDANFVLAIHPQYKNVSIGCGFSGHGFKFSTVIGEILADLVTKGDSCFDISLFSPARFK